MGWVDVGLGVAVVQRVLVVVRSLARLSHGFCNINCGASQEAFLMRSL